MNLREANDIFISWRSEAEALESQEWPTSVHPVVQSEELQSEELQRAALYTDGFRLFQIYIRLDLDLDH